MVDDVHGRGLCVEGGGGMPRGRRGEVSGGGRGGCIGVMLLPGHEHHVLLLLQLLLLLLLLLRLQPQAGLVEPWNRDAPSALPARAKT